MLWTWHSVHNRCSKRCDNSNLLSSVSACELWFVNCFKNANKIVEFCVCCSSCFHFDSFWPRKERKIGHQYKYGEVICTMCMYIISRDNLHSIFHCIQGLFKTFWPWGIEQRQNLDLLHLHVIYNLKHTILSFAFWFSGLRLHNRSQGLYRMNPISLRVNFTCWTWNLGY